MRLKAPTALIAVALAGCMTVPEEKPKWQANPALDIRHGMADGAAYYQMGRHKEVQGDLPAAEAFYEKALAADPKNVEFMNALGALYARRGETERAATIYRRAADLSPQSAHLYNNIGYTFHLQGRYAEAVDSLRRAVTIDPAYRRAWVNLEAAARKAGMADLAASAARRSLGGLPPEGGEASRITPALAEVSPPAPASRGGQQGISLVEVPSRPLADDGLLQLGNSSSERPVAASPKAATTPGRVVVGGEAGKRQLIPSRVEVSNGNGVSRYATGVASQLRDSGIHVSRVTNFTPFNVKQTYIEYRPDHAESAEALRSRLDSQVVLREVKMDRPGTDIRLVLGGDRLVTPARIATRENSRRSPEG